jgi:hypothetical protein
MTRTQAGWITLGLMALICSSVTVRLDMMVPS